MSTNELHIDELTYARAKQLAEKRNVSVEEIVSEAIERLALAPREESTGDSIIGLFADVPELVDQVVEDAYRSRQRDPLRQPSE